MKRLQDEFGVALTLRAVFDTPTVEELARAVEAAAGVEPVFAAPALVSVRRAGSRG